MTFIVNQVYIFLYAILGGAIAALFYDILRIKRRAIKTNVIIVSLEDIFYWLVAAMFLFITVYKSNSGEMRGYIFIGNIIGVILYESLLSEIIIKSSVMIINFIKRILLFIYKVLSYPFKLIYKIFKTPICFIIKLVFKLAKIFLNKGKIVSHKASCFTKEKVKRIPSLRRKLSKIRKVRKNT
jgi:spore cortex biosynthesis protein YabQ